MFSCTCGTRVRIIQTGTRIIKNGKSQLFRTHDAQSTSVTDDANPEWVASSLMRNWDSSSINMLKT